MDDFILITWLNDFVFCPASIYFHNLYGDANKISFQDTSQINGTSAHGSIDSGKYSDKRLILCGIDVLCEEYKLVGKIDIFDMSTGKLTERKKKIVNVYDGYVFQIYGQCFALREMGYYVKTLALYSLDDNKTYPVKLPEDDAEMLKKFMQLIDQIGSFTMDGFKQDNRQKCSRCIYEPLCDSSLLNEWG